MDVQTYEMNPCLLIDVLQHMKKETINIIIAIFFWNSDGAALQKFSPFL